MTRQFTVCRKIKFFAAHNLDGRPLHIHQFEVELRFSGPRSAFPDTYQNSLLINFYDIDKLWKNQVLPHLIDHEKRIQIKNSSCEALADWIFDRLLSLRSHFEKCLLDTVSVSDGDICVIVSDEERNQP